MRSIENDRSNYQLTQKNKSADGLVFNVVTQDMINKSTKPYRGHRFTKENVRILESWFCKEHREPISRYQGPRESNEEYQFISHSNPKTGFRIEEEKKNNNNRSRISGPLER
ncbi:BBT_HP_G0018090.mRNA.1.CDS.1 [Saccharomyces cerevisiae]|nr:BBT_HP_G0018090.mRNA.1.CDS.1 [Saccharomyces cerevisiae]CAI6398062.1 BBT_HP_G0018090.mRNA.1.CDS.1 [Saccharomyces cerevisiae]